LSSQFKSDKIKDFETTKINEKQLLKTVLPGTKNVSKKKTKDNFESLRKFLLLQVNGFNAFFKCKSYMWMMLVHLSNFIFFS